MMRRRQLRVWNIQQPIVRHELRVLNTQEDSFCSWSVVSKGRAGGEWRVVWAMQDVIRSSAFVPSATGSSPGAF